MRASSRTQIHPWHGHRDGVVRAGHALTWSEYMLGGKITVILVQGVDYSSVFI
jgi:hypothetical protein